ncbi:MAG: hypothetical protein ACLGI6_10245 [Gammaproteobacteria bacterium]
MDKHPLPKKQRTLPLFTLAIIAMSALFAACEPVPTAKVAKPSLDATSYRTKEQAMASLMALPELKAWSAQIEKASQGTRHGALMEYDTQPKDVNGKRYWQFSFVENGSEAAHRYESFLVSDSGDDILVDDTANDKLLTLADWRQQKRPLQQVSVQ